jgi:hypothetical protein
VAIRTKQIGAKLPIKLLDRLTQYQEGGEFTFTEALVQSIIAGLDALDPQVPKPEIEIGGKVEALSIEVANLRRMVIDLLAKDARKKKVQPVLDEHYNMPGEEPNVLKSVSTSVSMEAENYIEVEDEAPKLEGLTDDEFASLLGEEIDKVINTRELAIERGGCMIHKGHYWCEDNRCWLPDPQHRKNGIYF